MKWNSEKSTYYDRGRRAYSFGDELPESVIGQMGKNTVDEYVKSGLILDGKAAEALKKEALEKERLDLFKAAKLIGLHPHPKTGIDKLNAMIEDDNALQILKKEALGLGIDPSDDVTFAELTILVDEKKKENESDS